MCRLLGLISTALALTVAGCAGRGASVSRSAAPATRPGDPRALLSLEQIKPRPVMPAPAATAPSAAVPLDAVELYAKARLAQHENRRHTAINLLEKAITLDPNSFELHYALGKAYQGSGVSNDLSIKALERAAQLKPDDLDVQSLLGRQHLAKSNLLEAIERLRLARLSSDYENDEAEAAVVDYFLARALQQAGYDRAALECYDALLRRLQNPDHAIRANRELSYLAHRPEILYVAIGELYEKHTDYAEAHKAYELAAQRDPANFDLQARVVRMLAAAQRRDEAARKAAEILTRFRASSESLALIREVYAKIGRPDAVAAELRRLYRENPGDRTILFSLADVLRSDGTARQAEAVLEEAARRRPGDIEIIKRLFTLYAERDDVPAGARLLLESLASEPDTLRELAPMWAELLRPSRRTPLRIATLQKLSVAPQVEAAKQFWVSRVADLWNRDALARSALEQSARHSPPFAPAYRVLLADLWERGEWDEPQKLAAVADLISRAEEDAPLAEELRGLLELNRKKPREAITHFVRAMKLGGRSPDLYLTHAAALRLQGNDSAAEKAYIRLIAERPTYDEAYLALFRLYADQRTQNGMAQALKLLRSWLVADPGSINARLLQATIFMQGRETDAAEQLLIELFADYPDNPDVLGSMQLLYAQSGRLDNFTTLMEQERSRHPDNRTVVEALLGVYAAQNRVPDAVRVLDETRAAVAGDPDLLYYVSHLYVRMGQKQTSEDILQEVVKLDPTHAPANNDLGYTWADQGKHLQRAEAMIRVAVSAEPDNQSFLDSLGWVLYKRGQFEEARKYLDLAIGPARFPDPVVLDHLGDVLYRLGQTQQAVEQWRRSMQRLGQTRADREDLRQLRLVLQQKLKQAEAGESVSVAPIVETAAVPLQLQGTNGN